MKTFLIVVVLLVGSAFAAYKFGVMDAFTTHGNNGVHIGATVEEVEKAMGPPQAVLPNFGREQRIYKAASGNKYMITFEDGKVVEIH